MPDEQNASTTATISARTTHALRTSCTGMPRRLSCMIHLPQRVLEQLHADARAHVLDVENLPAVVPLAGGVYLATELAPEETRLSVGNSCKAGLLERPDSLCIVADY